MSLQPNYFVLWPFKKHDSECIATFWIVKIIELDISGASNDLILV